MNPKLSIVIPSYNQSEILNECLDQIYAVNTRDYEIVLIDNGSEPPLSLNYCGQLIRNEDNLGFPVAINQGILIAKGEYIIILNNDCLVTPKWDKLLLDKLDSYDIVGPRSNYVAGLQKTKIGTYNSLEELNVKSKKYSSEHVGETTDVNFIIGFCMAFRKSLWEDVGYFDESLWPCSGEEVDFCFRAKEKGYKIAIVDDCYIHHYGSQTFQEMQRDGQVNYQEVCVKCDKHLEEKWGKFWLNQAVNRELGNAHCESVKLNLGSGYRPQEGYINIDNREVVNPDIVCDVIHGLPFQDSSVDEVRAFDFLEHIPREFIVPLIEEIYRVLKPNGKFESFTPSTDGRGAFQDPTHVSFWNRNSWFYYTDPKHIELYGINARFTTEYMKDILTNKDFNIIHTHAIVTACK